MVCWFFEDWRFRFTAALLSGIAASCQIVRLNCSSIYIDDSEHQNGSRQVQKPGGPFYSSIGSLLRPPTIIVGCDPVQKPVRSRFIVLVKEGEISRTHRP